MAVAFGLLRPCAAGFVLLFVGLALVVAFGLVGRKDKKSGSVGGPMDLGLLFT